MLHRNISGKWTMSLSTFVNILENGFFSPSQVSWEHVCLGVHVGTEVRDCLLQLVEIE